MTLAGGRLSGAAALCSPRLDECTRSGSRRGADAIVPILTALVHPRSVVDVGCGTGEWLACFAQHGVSDFLGIDGDWVAKAALAIPPAKFLAADLARRIEVGRTFDLAVCLQVAEHLPPECADSLVHLLTSLAPVVLFSTAIPGQAGQGGLNCYWPPYWFQRFGARGFLPYDVIRSHVWRNPAVPSWYQQNCFLLVDRTHPLVAGALAQEAPFDPKGDLTLVPAQQAWNTEQPNLGAVPGIARRAIARLWTYWFGGWRGTAPGRQPPERRAARHARAGPRPEVSVVVCTRNRGAQLTACLEHLSRLRSADPWELVVVDNGSSDDTSDILRRYQKAAKFPVVLVHEPTPGSGRARNGGVAASRGEIIAFTDDDCYPAPDWLSHLRHAFADGRVGYVGGRFLLYDPADAPIGMQTSTDFEWIAPHSLLLAGSIPGGNMAVRREVFEDVGVFDPLLGAGMPLAAEDIELVARASAAGWCGVYYPDAVVYHHHRRRSRFQVDRRRRFYSRGNGAYYAKFLLRRDTRMLGVRHWFASLRRNDLRTFAHECSGAVQYVLARAAITLRGDGRMAPSSNDGP